MNQNVKIANQKVAPTYRLFAKGGMFQDYKTCTFCGQNKIPFKKGICPGCCNQISDVQYVKDPKEYVKSNYGHVKMGITKIHQGSDDL